MRCDPSIFPTSRLVFAHVCSTSTFIPRPAIPYHRRMPAPWFFSSNRGLIPKESLAPHQPATLHSPPQVLSPWVTMGHTHSSSHGGSGSMANRNRERLEVPIPYNSGLCFWAMFLGMYPQNMVKNMVKNMVPPFEDPGDPLTGHCGCQVSNTRRSSSARPAKRWCAARLAQQE